MTRGEGFIFNVLFGKPLRESSLGVAVRRNFECRDICAVAAVVEYGQASTFMQWALVGESGFLFPGVLESGDKGKLALTPSQMTYNLQAHLRAAGMEHKRYSQHSFRVGGAASHHMDGTAMEVRGRDQQIRRDDSVRVGVKRNETFAGHGLHPGRRFTAVGGVREIIRGVPTGQPAVAEPRTRLT